MRYIEDIIHDIDILSDKLVKLIRYQENEKTEEGKEYYEKEMEIVSSKMEEIEDELIKAEERERFNTSNERLMNEAGHSERDFL